MSPPRWFQSNRRSPPPTTAVHGPPAPSGPNGFWITDPDFRDRLYSATLTLLDIVEDCLNDDFPLTEFLNGARDHAEHMLGVPSTYGILVEAEAAAQIVQAAGLEAGSPFGLAIAQGLAGIEQLPVEQQQQLVRAAARHYAITAPSRSVSVQAASPQPLRPAPGRSR
ncbi:hypothetical protein ACM01_41680 [Streptomyces viridochromogenes]|uniref:Uncharacterized protein n=1 Tax=Streptomyces viridochromogenes TaxID=1938 RepID=A0A0J7YW88_STRVR|nr:hypothetical protein [Streptomyces viridochromogenes]KMS67732.1 hypothetical protein ACM01_41680 [Streptomyces viridochromogenes]